LALVVNCKTMVSKITKIECRSLVTSYITAYISLSCNFIIHNKKLPEDDVLISKHVEVLYETDNC
jgi:hypothetical protein